MDLPRHTDPSFKLRVYRHGMRRDEGSRRSLRELVGFDWTATGSSRVFGDAGAFGEFSGTDTSLGLLAPAGPIKNGLDFCCQACL
jgi:hypothetical protein